MKEKQVRLLLVDDHQLYLDGLVCLIAQVEGLEVVATASHGLEALQQLEMHAVDLMLLDLNMPTKDGISIIPEVKRAYPHLKILVVTNYKEQKIVKEVYKSGVDGMFFKSSPWSRLREAIEEVMRGEVYMPSGLSIFPRKTAPKLQLERSPYRDNFEQMRQLTPREVEVLKLLSEAKGVKEIAGELFISQETVSVHKKNIMKKLDLHNIAGMVKYALEHDIA